MKQLVIISGKGGTGKTTLAASFAALGKNQVICDCDVDAADLHLLLKPRRTARQSFKGMAVASIDAERCTQCGRCGESCRFSAIRGFEVDELACEGCGVCALVCRHGAISFRQQEAGSLFYSRTDYGDFYHARLKPGVPNSGRLVSLLRQQAKERAEKQRLGLIISDGSPGVGCPVIASLTGTDLAMIVIEPTLSGAHDLERVLELTRHFGIKSVVCLNKYDINEDNASKIERRCRAAGVPVVASLPYDPVVTKAMVRGKTVVEYANGEMAGKIRDLWSRTKEHLNAA